MHWSRRKHPPFGHSASRWWWSQRGDFSETPAQLCLVRNSGVSQSLFQHQPTKILIFIITTTPWALICSWHSVWVSWWTPRNGRGDSCGVLETQSLAFGLDMVERGNKWDGSLESSTTRRDDLCGAKLEMHWLKWLQSENKDDMTNVNQINFSANWTCTFPCPYDIK